MTDERCELCGRGPATSMLIRRHVGMIVMQKFYKVDAPLCREHGLELAKRYLGKTLLLGWWGFISFFVNFFAVFTDVRAVMIASRLDPPAAAPQPAVPPQGDGQASGVDATPD